MKILLFSGFLGSGKTTVINRVLHTIDEELHQTAAVIENEIGEFGIDDLLVQRAGVVVRPLFGGCVCCEIQGSLIDAIDEIEETINPDWLIIELTGVARLTSLKNIIDRFARQGRILVVSVVDAGRWEKLAGKLAPMTEAQLAGSDALILNKTDLAPSPEAVAAGAAGFAPGRPVLFFSREKDNRTEILRLLAMKRMPDPFAGMFPSVAPIGGDDDAEIGVCSRQYPLAFPQPVSCAALDAAVREKLVQIGKAVAEGGLLAGHVKAALKVSADNYAGYSSTSPGVVDSNVSYAWNPDAQSDRFLLLLTAIAAGRSSAELAEIVDGIKPNDLI